MDELPNSLSMSAVWLSVRFGSGFAIDVLLWAGVKNSFMKFGLQLIRLLAPALLLALFACPHLWAQPLRFESYSTENGLTRNIGYDIAQTPEGFMWFATPNGLNRFDGYQIKTYKKNSEDPFSLCHNDIRTLITDDRGNLWAGTPQGIRIYEPHRDRFYRPSELYKLPKTVDSLFASRFLKDIDGTIWILTTDQKLYGYKKKGNAIKQYFEKQEAGEPLRSTGLNEDGRICVSSMNEIYIFNGRSFSPLSLKSLITTESAPLYIREFAFTHGELWVCSTFKGIFRIRMAPKLSVIEHITIQSKKWNLSHNSIECILKDRTGNLWIGSINDGLYFYDFSTGNLRVGQHSAADQGSLPANYVISLFEDRQGIIWAGLMGGGIAKYEKELSLFQTISFADKPTKNVKPDDMIMGIYKDSNRVFYIGTLTGGMIKNVLGN